MTNEDTGGGALLVGFLVIVIGFTVAAIVMFEIGK